MLVNLKFTLMHDRPGAASIPTPVEPSCPSPVCASPVCLAGLLQWTGSSSSAPSVLQVLLGLRMSCRFMHQNPQSDRPDSSLQQHAAPPARLRSFADGMSFIFTSSSLISSLTYFLLHFGLSLPAVITITIPDTQLNIHLHRLSSPQPRKSGFSDCSGSEECWGSLLCLSLFRLFSQHPLRNTVNKSLCFHCRWHHCVAMPVHAFRKGCVAFSGK